MASQTKDRITCHVLDTSAGRPARGVRVHLSTTVPSSSPSTTGGVLREFESQTDDDGRVKAWLPFSDATASGEVPVYTLEDVLGALQGPSRWTLRFDTAAYFGGEDATFFPEAVVVFTVREGQHYHVPLLLSPYSYTTYRGS
ncbi:hydroxyisourate hydrolase [Colletotrichum graminicola]|uniref:5-hydroxyisourate hydrolase n=1 Tax=Colletotrichum graminicola (strain M1.001 / M2 / FGSC 10212) TaxID=645133 RepID=E3QBW8_COLGM|nr:hydroxyisourate hydrolase [Colletotrichum graminicola M1.001]EFQ28203.1 hydroxyisourate hydrolase [Colletotrichum graminicola M1.001]WDK20512.1 hydroxyisourate hydrolase [Colletotrichum graminicola]